MADPTWVESNNSAFYGHLMFSDFQSAGYDLHVTFQKNREVHLSIYSLAQYQTKADKLDPPGNLWMKFAHNGLALGPTNGNLLKNAVSPNDPMPIPHGFPNFGTFLLFHCNRKAQELNIASPKPDTVAPTKQRVGAIGTSGYASAFPSLGNPKGS